jgi:pectate lyase
MAKSLNRKISSIAVRRLFVLTVMTVILTTASVVASAEQNTFTKWITTAPSMAGVVGGADGDGTYAGEILKYTEGPTTVIEALYHFKGSIHPFTALVHVEQTGLKAVISGVVTEGWEKGDQVVGEYTQIKSTQSPNGTAFQGTLNIMSASVASN